jgi:hypothetical protein
MPPPGLESPSDVQHYGNSERCLDEATATATISQKEMMHIYHEYVQLRSECLGYELQRFYGEARLTELPQSECAAPRMLPQRPQSNITSIKTKCALPKVPPPAHPAPLLPPPGVFIKKNRSDSISSLSTSASIATVSPRAPAPAVQTTASEEKKHELRSEISETDGSLRITWPVDARKLTTKDQQIISPSFEIVPECSFRLMLKPTAMGDKKGQACFKKARGCGSVDLKLAECRGSAPTLSYSISIGDSSAFGPIQHDFKDSCLSRNDQTIDFTKAVDPATSTFFVTLVVHPAE